EPLHERLVDLHRVERQLPDVADRRIARAEVVDGQTNAQVSNLGQFPTYGVDVLDQGGLGDLQAQLTRVRASGLEGPGDGGHEIGLHQLTGRHVHRDAEVGRGCPERRQRAA